MTLILKMWQAPYIPLGWGGVYIPINKLGQNYSVCFFHSMKNGMYNYVFNTAIYWA